MSAITPDSYIKLVRFDVTKENQLTFSDGVAQVNFFLNTLQGVEMQASSYQRKDYKVRFEASIDSIDIYNYMIVRNTSYNYKYYFYYITDMTYINDEMTEITIKLDVFQTYQFEYNYKRSFVEREHVNSDIVGEHTVPEGLETGEYVVNTYDYYTEFDDKVLIVQADRAVNETRESIADDRPPVSSLNGIMCYGKVYVVSSYLELAGLLYWYSHNEYSGGTDSIKNMYFVPRSCINWNDVHYVGLPDTNVYEYSSLYPMLYDYETSKPSSLDGYIPKNKKLLTFPYCYLVASNNNGSSNIYQYEKFKENKCQFDFSCIPTPRSFNKNVTTKLYAKLWI